MTDVVPRTPRAADGTDNPFNSFIPDETAMPVPCTPRAGKYRSPFAADGYVGLPAGHEFTFDRPLPVSR